MAKDCLDPNQVLRSGTSQAQRVLAALDAQYARVDERSLSDLVLFAKKYGAYLNYYDLTNIVTGDWQDLMSRDAVVGIATVADWKTNEFLQYIKTLCEQINKPQAGDNPPQSYRYIFDFVFSLANALNNVLISLPGDINYTDYLNTAILSNLAAPLQELAKYYADSVTVGLFAGSLLAADKTAPFDQIAPPTPLVFIGATPWLPAAFSVPAITIVAGTDLTKIVNHYFFTGALNSFINGVINIVKQTPDYLTQVLENYPYHTPHYALYLSFLQLFKNAQDHLNEFTRRHLEFYYKKILHLNNNIGVPDLVHLVFTLQKTVPPHLVSAGTKFKAGKDANNNDLFYVLTDDIVVNRASVTALRSLSLSSSALNASSMANSADGLGAKLTSTDKSWNTFGSNATANAATIGFAVASNLLFLNEGARTIAIRFDCPSLTGPGYNASDLFKARCTGNKNWFDADNVVVKTSGTSLEITITVNGSAPPVVPYSAKIHGGNYPQSLPMVQVLLINPGQYNFLRALTINDIVLTVEADGVKNLSLQNDESPIDASKPFKPFGQFPGKGASLIIGSKEIFQKPLTGLFINFTLPATVSLNIDSTATQLLSQGAWGDNGISVIVETSNVTETFGSALTAANIPVPDFTANEPYKATSANGFIKLSYAGDSSLANYLKPPTTPAYVSINPPGVVYQPPAATSLPTGPIASAINIHYQAQKTFLRSTDTYETRDAFFYNIEPFGFREIHPATAQHPTDLAILSSFDFDDNASGQNEGELWIGLTNVEPGSTHSILFEVSEGSSNPLEEATSVSWRYLSANNWIDIEVGDQTHNLSTSGLVVFNLPGTETLDNTRADAGLLWLKAVVVVNTDAVCRIIDILANSAKASFVQDILQKIDFTSGIPSNTISKPAIPDGAIKQVAQPYGSFGGTPAENDQQFDQRVSERLRHKHRAVTAWDYERLVLQQYPQIHKVKCINHTGIKTKTKQYSELKPGHVLVVTVPDLSTLAGANPLLPFTSVGLLNEIQNYLLLYTSPFVKLKVVNPLLEGVKFTFNVSFKDGSNITYHINELDKAITNFLIPWAFGSQSKDIEFGGKIEKSVVLNMVQSHPSVDFVTCFTMDHYSYRNSGFQLIKQNVEEAVATTAMSILVPFSKNDPAVPLNNTISLPANCDCNG